MSSLSPKALLRKAYGRRLAEDARLTHQRLADLAGLPRPRVSEALSASGGEPRPENTAKILAALGFELDIVDVGMPRTETPGDR